MTMPTGEPFEPFGQVYEQAVAAVDKPVVPAPLVAARSLPAPTVSPTGTRFVESVSGTSSSSAGTTTSDGVNQIGGFGSMPIPADLAQFDNGRVPVDALQPIEQSGHRLVAGAASAWDQVVEAARQEGLTLRITDSYRTFDQQVDLAERKGLYRNGGLAATPGTSNHGWGLAVDADVRDPAVLAWLRANGPRFGFVEAVPREPWHWEYRPGQA